MTWPTLINRILSLTISVAIVVALLSAKHSDRDAFSCIIGLLFALCLIWFGEALGGFTGYIGRGGNIDTESPGWLVAAFGWILLVGVPALIFFVNRPAS